MQRDPEISYHFPVSNIAVYEVQTVFVEICSFSTRTAVLALFDPGSCECQSKDFFDMVWPSLALKSNTVFARLIPFGPTITAFLRLKTNTISFLITSNYVYGGSPARCWCFQCPAWVFGKNRNAH